MPKRYVGTAPGQSGVRLHPISTNPFLNRLYLLSAMSTVSPGLKVCDGGKMPVVNGAFALYVIVYVIGAYLA